MSSAVVPHEEVAVRAPPAVEEFVAELHGRLRPRDLRNLHTLLATLPSADGTLAVAMAAVEGVTRWVGRGPAPAHAEAPPIARLRLLVEVLEQIPSWRDRFVAALAHLGREGQLEPALEAGLPNDRGLLPESSDRLARRFLPSPESERDLGAYLSRLFPKTRGRDPSWLAEVPTELAARLGRLFFEGAAALGLADPLAPLKRALSDTMALVATRTSALGLSQEMRARSPEVPLPASPFYLLPRLCDALYTGIGSIAACREQISGCYQALDNVRAHLEQYGVSVDVVYRIAVIEKNLGRLRLFLALSAAPSLGGKVQAALTLLGELAEARQRDRSLRAILSTNTELLARKVIEHAGETGEHYITVTRGGWWKMLGSGAGGGLVTAATVVFKYFVYWGHFPLFVEGTLASANYALSFLLMQLFGFTLATKQPSMIAAALAGALRGSDGKGERTGPIERGDLEELVTLIQRIVRSQLAAAIGNVAMVAVASRLFHILYLHARGVPFLDAKAAEHTIHSFHWLHSGTAFYAALTGVLLWLSSLCAGWLENWVTYRRLPEGIAHHRLGRFVGQRTMRWLGRSLQHNVAGIGGNISIGLLLGMTPVVAKFFGLPIEVRHVTLSTGSLTLAASTVGVHAPGFWGAVAGVGLMLALNFSVSFACALEVALRARGREHANRRLLAAIGRRLVTDPLPFILPVGRDVARPARGELV